MTCTRRAILTGAGAALAVPAARPRQVIDAHAHLAFRRREEDRKLIDAADKLGIDVLCCSILPPARPATPEAFRECNATLRQAIGRFPGRILGYVHVNPGYTREALEEVRRYVQDHGFIGVKLYNEYRADEPVLHPLVELSIELGIPLLQHGGHVSWLGAPQPRISDAGHLAVLARAYPEAMLICAHVCGGGDWEWTLKALRAAPPSVYLDTSGSVIDDGVIEAAVAHLGAPRLLFACDSSLTASMGRLRGAQITEAERSQILGGNMAGLLARRRK